MAFIYLLRHARTVANKEGKYCGRTDSPLLDSSLSNINHLPVPRVDAVYSSPSPRCLDTAASAGFDDVITADALSELDFGEWEQKTFEDVYSSHRSDAERYLDMPLSFTFPKGESFYDLSCRVKSFCSLVLSGHFERDDTIAIIGHNGSLKMLFLELMDLDHSFFWKFSLEHEYYTILEYTKNEDAFHFMLKGLNTKKIL